MGDTGRFRGGWVQSASGEAWDTSTSVRQTITYADASYQCLKDFASSITFGERQLMAQSVARRFLV
jgi:hypothetical protein